MIISLILQRSRQNEGYPNINIIINPLLLNLNVAILTLNEIIVCN